MILGAELDVAGYFALDLGQRADLEGWLTAAGVDITPVVALELTPTGGIATVLQRNAEGRFYLTGSGDRRECAARRVLFDAPPPPAWKGSR